MDNGDLIFGGVVALLSTIFNFGYFFRHANGKKYLRLLTGMVMLFFCYASFACLYGIHSDPHKWAWILYAIPMWDIVVDWKSKSKRSHS